MSKAQTSIPHLQEPPRDLNVQQGIESSRLGNKVSLCADALALQPFDVRTHHPPAFFTFLAEHIGAIRGRETDRNLAETGRKCGK
jgi:hypothetical protein